MDNLGIMILKNTLCTTQFKFQLISIFEISDIIKTKNFFDLSIEEDSKYQII